MFDILLKSCSFVFIIILGYVLKRAGLFKERDYKVVTSAVIYITLPAAVITSFAAHELDFSLILAVLIGFAFNKFTVDKRSEDFDAHNFPYLPLREITFLACSTIVL